MNYDPESNILSWEITRGRISHAREVGNLIIHLSAKGKPIMIEMLDASSFIGQFETLQSLKDVKKILPVT